MRLIKLPEVEARVALKRSYIYELVSQGQFPHPIKLSKRASAWLEADIDAWIQARVAASRAQAA